MLSSHLETSKMPHYRQLFSINFPLPSELSQKTSELSHKTWEISQKTWEIFRKTLDIFPKTWEFFFSPLREKISHSKEEQRTAGYQLPRLALVI